MQPSAKIDLLEEQNARLTKEKEMLLYWLLRALEALYREGWEEGPSVNETRVEIVNVLANYGFDPANNSEAVEKLLKRKPAYYID